VELLREGLLMKWEQLVKLGRELPVVEEGARAQI
jgi:hypothetical protein